LVRADERIIQSPGHLPETTVLDGGPFVPGQRAEGATRGELFGPADLSH
jgi:hypothetical protein